MRKSMSMSNWQVFDHGIETLVKSVAPDDKRAENARQGFTLEDLLLKVRSKRPGFTFVQHWLIISTFVSSQFNAFASTSSF